MFHGEFSRGFMNGANFKDDTFTEPKLAARPLDEAGNATEKFWAFKIDSKCYLKIFFQYCKEMKLLKLKLILMNILLYFT